VRSCDGSHKLSDGQVVVASDCATAAEKQQRRWMDGSEALEAVANNSSEHNIKRGCNAKTQWRVPVELMGQN